jgi:hypothetical protein
MPWTQSNALMAVRLCSLYALTRKESQSSGFNTLYNTIAHLKIEFNLFEELVSPLSILSLQASTTVHDLHQCPSTGSS